MADVPLLSPTAHDARDHSTVTGIGGVGNVWTMSKTTSQTLTSNADTLITFDRADVDGGGGVIDLANDQFVIPATGFYLAIYNWIWETTVPNGAARIATQINGSASGTAPLMRADGGTLGAGGGVQGTVTLSLAASDTLQMLVHPGAAVTPTARGNASRVLSTAFSLVRIT